MYYEINRKKFCKNDIRLTLTLNLTERLIVNLSQAECSDVRTIKLMEMCSFIANRRKHESRKYHTQ